MLNNLKEHFYGKEVTILGNAKILESSSIKIKGLICTVNAGLKFCDEKNINSDLHWIQDLRMMTLKANFVEPYVNRTQFIAHNSDIQSLTKIACPKFIKIRMLGYSGFSKDPNIGVFHGYNSVYGLLQILNYCEVKKINLIGISLNYFSENTRFYQTARGLDVDIHRATEQLLFVSSAIKIMEESGIEFKIIGKSFLNNVK